MLALINILFFSLLLLASLFSIYFFQNKRFLSSAFCVALFSKIILFYLLESGLKYTFVLDSLKYEMDAWNLMKAQVSNTEYILEAFERAEYFNPFTQLLVKVFSLFGRAPQIVTLINIFLSFGIYFICLKIYALFDRKNPQKLNDKSAFFLALVLLFYPSLNVWSVTNTKDPAILFFSVLALYLFFEAKNIFTEKSRWRGLIIFMLSCFSFYVSNLFRPYILPIFFAGISLGCIVHLFNKILTGRTIGFSLIGLAVTSLYLYQLFQPQQFADVSNTIYKIRSGFLNENWQDDISKSAFLVNYSFASTIDYLFFIPQALSYYILGPFPWQIHSLAESLGLVEVIMVLALGKYFFRGLKLLSHKHIFEVNILLSTLFVFAISQSMTISNMGTIFRHRTFSILIYIIIAAGGFKFDQKEFKSS